MNAYLFRIGIFPWFMLVATLLFLPPEWLRPSNWRRARGGTGREEPKQGKHKGDEVISWRDLELKQRATFALLGAYLMLQLLLPLRHFIYPGNVSWTEEGNLFAWHMMLRHKAVEARFFLIDRVAGTMREIDPKRTNRQLVSARRWNVCSAVNLSRRRNPSGTSLQGVPGMQPTGYMTKCSCGRGIANFPQEAADSLGCWK